MNRRLVFVLAFALIVSGAASGSLHARLISTLAHTEAGAPWPATQTAPAHTATAPAQAPAQASTQAPAADAAPQAPAGAAQAEPQADAEPTAARPIELADIEPWKALGSHALSNDGKWVAYRVAPLRGDSEVVIRSTSTDTEHRIAVGDGNGPAPVFSDDSAYVAVTVMPTRDEAKAAKKSGKPANNSVAIVELAGGTKTTLEKVRSFAFSGETPGWIAIHRTRAEGRPAGGGRAGGPSSSGGPRGSDEDDTPKGSDLILRDLVKGTDLSIGNVSDYAFDKSGRWLAYTIDAADQTGNGLQLRDMTTGIVRVLDSGKASYEEPAWTDKGDGLAVLKGVKDKAYRNKRYSVVGFTSLGAAGTPVKVTYDPADDTTFPAEMTISPNRAPRWTDDLSGLVFGIHELEKSDRPAPAEDDAASGDKPADAKPAAPPAPEDEDEKPNLVIWHWKDPRLQSQQEVQEMADRRFNYVSVYYPASKKFVRLADDEVRTVNIAPKDKWAVGYDVRPYERMSHLDGRNFRDVYAINVATGERKLALERNRWIFGPSPDGTKFLYYDDKHFHVYDMAAGRSRNVTANVPANFVDIEDDHNIVDPPRFPWGWSSDSRFVVLSDGWDIWKVPAAAGDAVNLTVNGTKDQIRYQGRYNLYPDDEGIDLSKPQYVDTFGEWTKKNGIARLEPGKTGAKSVLWGDAGFGKLTKAGKADVVIYTRESRADAPNFYVTTSAFGEGKRISDVYPEQKNFAWSSDAMLLEYTSDKGRKLTGSLFLPANYVKGKQYPMVVYIYERLTQGHNLYSRPMENGFNRSVYTSSGYAVLMPDITYHVNDPGMSAVWSVVPAVKAAIATGVVDEARIGLQGHSWGGYQTSFLVTQTDLFRAAVAGAPLTNMISMYSLIYKNAGITNGQIFESSQGRFSSGYSDNWEAYARNSPVYHAQNVKTPLMILHNDKDGAVDFTQGMEYFNTLRRMDKTVILLEYPGENHGLAQPANRLDYTRRMKEWFDHYLKDAPAPDWMLEGVPRLEMDEHLKQRMKKADDSAPAAAAKPSGGGGR